MIFENTIIPWVGKTGKLLGCLVNSAFQENGIPLTREQWIFLMKLSDLEGIPQNDLAFITERDKASLTRLVQTLEKKGFIERKSSEVDRRMNLVFITDSGIEMYQKATPFVKNIIKVLEQGISEEEIATTIETLQKIQINIREFNQLKK